MTETQADMLSDELEATNAALVVQKPQVPLTARALAPPAPPPQPQEQITPAQARVEAVANLLHKAYERASTLDLTKAEIEKLQAPFPDEAFFTGAAGKENLIYIEHASLRDRLNQVVGLGKWSLVVRRHWAEKFRFYSKRDQRQAEGDRIYVEAVLLVKGCFVGESIGNMDYYPNDSTNYGDAFEGAKSAALRRCCKELGVGLQAWHKDFCQGWFARRNATNAPQRAAKTAPPSDTTPAPAPQNANAAQETPIDGRFVQGVSVSNVECKEGTTRGKPWKLFWVFLSDGTKAGTFDEKLAALADIGAGNPNALYNATTRPGRKAGTIELVDLMPVEKDDVMP